MKPAASIVPALACVAALLSTPGPVDGQAAAEPRARANRPAPVLTNAELGTMLDAYAIVQAQSALQLNDDQYGKFVSRLKRLQDARRKGTQSRNRLLQELRKLTSDTIVEEAVIGERLKALGELEDQTSAAIRQEYAALDEILDTRQRVRFRIFEEQLERRKLDLLIRARERARDRK
jgi:hypothetical protein